MAKNSLQLALMGLLQQFLKQQQRKKNKSASVYVWIVLSLLAITVLARWGGERDFSQNTPSASKTAVPKGAEVSCQVKKIYDGDTVEALCENMQVRIRLNGIDAPEMKQEPYGKIAQEALQKKLQRGDFILQSQGPDFYQRTLGYLFVDGENINLSMVKQGFAVAYDDKSTLKMFRDAERQAQQKKIGVWAEEGLHQDPKQWRRYHKNN